MKNKKFVISFFLCFVLRVFSFAEAISIAAVGDIMMGSTYPKPQLPNDEGRWLFKEAEEILKKADITFGNLEGVLCDGGTCKKDTNKKHYYAFRTPTSFGINLKNAGFDILNLANNHILDFGYYGLNSTNKTLNKLDIKYIDCYEGNIAVFELIHKETTTVAFIGFYWGVCKNSLLNIEDAKTKVASLAQKYDIVVVSFHGGTEGKDAIYVKDEMEYFFKEPRGNLIKFSRSVIDAGADLVIGHGPHVPRALELYNGKLIAYSLGNFCTYKGISVEGFCGYAPLLWIELNKEGEFVSGKIYSFIQKYAKGPIYDKENRAFNLIRRLSLENFPDSLLYFTEDGKIYPTK